MPAASPTHIVPATAANWPELWPVLEPIIRAGETYPLPQDMTAEDAKPFWLNGVHSVWRALRDGVTAGTYQLQANRKGGGAHVANAAFMTARGFEGQGIARAMGLHALETARAAGFRAMQFNFVVSRNVRAVRLWQSLGFQIVGTLPEAFRHPSLGYVDAYVMFRSLSDIVVGPGRPQ